MKKGTIITLSTIGVIALFILMIFTSYVSTYNYGNRMDNQVKAQYDNMKNVLTQYSQRIQELVQVPTMYKDDLKEVVQASMSGRYGKDGSKAVFQFLKEHNQNLDPSLYKQVMQNIESGRKDFEFENKKLIDIKNEYQTEIGSFYRGMMLRIAGFPRINLEEYKIITNTYSNKTFEQGYEEAPIKLR